MKRLLRIGIVSLAAAVMLPAAFHFMRAQGEVPSDSEANHALVDPSGTFVAHTLLGTYFTQGCPETIYPGPAHNWHGFDNPTTFRCWRPCTLEVEETVNVGNMTVASNYWALGGRVDGSGLPNWSWTGTVPSDESWVQGAFNQSIPLTPGSHTVQSFIMSTDGVQLGVYHVNYRIYEP